MNDIASDTENDTVGKFLPARVLECTPWTAYDANLYFQETVEPNSITKGPVVTCTPGPSSCRNCHQKVTIATERCWSVRRMQRSEWVMPWKQRVALVLRQEEGCLQVVRLEFHLISSPWAEQGPSTGIRHTNWQQNFLEQIGEPGRRAGRQQPRA